jgi:hypothetical protein
VPYDGCRTPYRLYQEVEHDRIRLRVVLLVLFLKELFDGHICLLECNLAANCYSPMPHTSHIFPISDVACGGAHRAVIVQVSDIDCAVTCYDTQCVYYCSGWTLLCWELHVSPLLRTQNPLAFSHPWIT